jgi:glycosyltransferase involved in cell wall biosynthesis
MGASALRAIEVVPGISEEASGPSYSVMRLCESLIALGHDVSLAALDLGPVAGAAFLEMFPLGAGPRKLGRSPAMKRWLARQAGSSRVDILHNHGMWQMSAVYPGWAARKWNVPLVVSPRGAFSRFAMKHGSPLKAIFWPLLQRPAIEAAGCFHATAEAEYEDIRRLGFRQPVAIIPNGIDIPAARPRRPAGARTLLFLGRIHKIKGLDMLLRAWRRVQGRFPEWRLDIVGSDDSYYGSSGYLDQLRGLAASLGVERARFVGELRGDAKTEALSQAELFILPSYSENFGVAVAEALAAGTAAIVTRGAPWPRLGEKGAGWWVETSDDGVAGALDEALARPPGELDAMGKLGRAWMESDFGWERIAATMAETYAWTIRGGAAPCWVRTD